MENVKLEHSGIKGMRWGIRRFQNKDGSLTPEGKKRYGDDSSDNTKKDESPKAHDDYKKAHEKRDVRTLSDKELNDINNRLIKEQQYEKLTAEQQSGAKKWIKDTTVKIGKEIAEDYMRKAAKGLVQAGLEKIALKNQKTFDTLNALGWVDGDGVFNALKKDRHVTEIGKQFDKYKKKAGDLFNDDVKKDGASNVKPKNSKNEAGAEDTTKNTAEAGAEPPKKKYESPSVTDMKTSGYKISGEPDIDADTNTDSSKIKGLKSGSSLADKFKGTLSRKNSDGGDSSDSSSDTDDPSDSGSSTVTKKKAYESPTVKNDTARYSVYKAFERGRAAGERERSEAARTTKTSDVHTLSVADLAKRYGVSESTIYNARKDSGASAKEKAMAIAYERVKRLGKR